MHKQFGEPQPRAGEQVRAIVWQFVLVNLAGAALGIAVSFILKSVIPLLAIFVWMFGVQMFYRRMYPDLKNSRWWD
jgi:fatty acid desaturase